MQIMYVLVIVILNVLIPSRCCVALAPQISAMCRFLLLLAARVLPHLLR